MQNPIRDNIIDLEEEVKSFKTDVKTEEQNKANINYSIIKDIIDNNISKLPYPEVKPYDTGFDYDDIEAIQYKKGRNQKFWNEDKRLSKYYDNTYLYCGHIKTNDGEFFLTDNPDLVSAVFDSSKGIFVIINVDDKRYNWAYRCWRYPSNESKAIYSRNIIMKNKSVVDVDIVLDKDNELYNSITDSYLRNVLIRNKNNTDITSIIQTIQKEQDNIRTLDKNISFIVQGCAGSGKTMILLHRLRYLLFNENHYEDDFVFLVPGFGFKEYIKKISTNFRIRTDKIFPYIEYYRICAGYKQEKYGKDYNELVFDNSYLSTVYSQKIIAECYQTVFDVLNEQVSNLEEKCEKYLNDIIYTEKKVLQNRINAIKSLFLSKMIDMFDPFKMEIGVDVLSFDNIEDSLSKLNNQYKLRLTEVRARIEESKEVIISPEDERIYSDSQLNSIKEEIDLEKKALDASSVFTVILHRRKLALLQERYEERLAQVKSLIAEDDKEELRQKKITEVFYFGSVTVEDAKALIDSINKEYKIVLNKLQNENNRLKHLTGIIRKKYNNQINCLKKIKTDSITIHGDSIEYVERLIPSYDFFRTFFESGKALFDSFYSLLKDDEEKELFKKKCAFFSLDRTEYQLKAYLYNVMLNSCKKKVKERFNVVLCDKYKHYWFLALYFKYLSYGSIPATSKYIFIDEAQDLSPAEFELITKINTKNDYPVINAFGDVNQTISSHGIYNWNNQTIITNVFQLTENFRNPNQITRYCNRNLPFKMKEIGVDMEEVSVYKDWQQFLNNKDIISGYTFIVKDDYFKLDLLHLIDKTIKKDVLVYTVKEVKGFEFKEIIVVDTDMTDNEKYISYTRALKKLNVILSIPKIMDRNESLILQGEDISANESVNF